MKPVILAALALAVILPAQESGPHNPPAVREGLWSVHMQITENPGDVKHEISETVCRTHAYDDFVRERVRKHGGCMVLSEKSTATTYAIEWDCSAGGIRIHTKSNSTFSGDSAIHTESDTTNTPALMGVASKTAITDEKYLGACPAGAQPGDITMPDGTRTNSYKK